MMITQQSVAAILHIFLSAIRSFDYSSVFPNVRDKVKMGVMESSKGGKITAKRLYAHSESCKEQQDSLGVFQQSGTWL